MKNNIKNNIWNNNIWSWKHIFNNVGKTKDEVHGILSKTIFDILNEIKQNFKWFNFNENLVKIILETKISEEKFKKIFFSKPYNKNILMCDEKILEYLNFDEIDENTDLVLYLIDKIWLSEDEFVEKTKKVKDKLFFPNLYSFDVAQSYALQKLQKLLPNSEIIFWDNPKVIEKKHEKTVKSDSVWFIDFIPSDTLNLCILKLLETEPDKEKLQKLEEIFEKIDGKIFIWGSTFVLPFQIPENFTKIIFPKLPKNNWEIFFKDWILLNSMWFLNSAFYSKKVKWAFVFWSHNIWEPLHSNKLSVINDSLENKFNHNWFLSYFWEKSDLILYVSWNKDNDKIADFLNISEEELQKRTTNFQKDYEEKILPLVRWLLYNFLEKNNFIDN